MHEHCGNFTTLAALSAERYIARCSCGALHLQWGTWSLQLQPSDLEPIERAFERSQSLCVPDKSTFVLERAAHASYAVSLEASGMYRFWYGKSAVLLGLEDWLALRNLVRIVRQQIDPKRPFERQLEVALSVN
jgi:hypothetical protein